jgi:hypothetical protein
MKANLKGLSGIKGLLLLHGEKLAMGLVVLVALYFIYSSLQLPSLDDTRQADDLQREITQTRSAVEQSQWPANSGDPGSDVVKIFEPVAQSDDFSVKHKDYELSRTVFNPPVVSPTVLRIDPVLLNAIGLEGHGGSGLFGFIDENVRNARRLAAMEKEQEQLKKQQEEQERQMRQQQQGQGQYGDEGFGGRGGYGVGEDGQFVDPEHPKRRMVEGMVRPTGIPLMGDERVEQVYWATVVAKVPIREQMKLYQDAFENARGGFDPMRDFPRYVGYQVERAEVAPGQELKWQPVSVYDGQRKSLAGPPIAKSAMTMKAMNELSKIATTTWAAQVPEVVDDRYLDYILTFPLPPLAGRDWGADVTHSEIPLAVDTPPLEEELQPLAEQQPGAKPEDRDSFENPDQNQPFGPGRGYEEGTLGGRGGYERGGYERGGYGGGYGRGGLEGRGGLGGGEYGYGRGGMGGRYGGGGEEGGYGRGGMLGGGGMRSATQKTTLAKGVDFWLLRFFDFSVQPGKRYKYRVKLVLADPNHLLPANLLASTVLDRKDRKDHRFVEEWSEPTPTVGIPLAGSVRLVQVKPQAEGSSNEEPAAKLLV